MIYLDFEWIKKSPTDISRKNRWLELAADEILKCAAFHHGDRENGDFLREIVKEIKEEIKISERGADK